MANLDWFASCRFREAEEEESESAFTTVKFDWLASGRFREAEEEGGAGGVVTSGLGLRRRGDGGL